VKPLSQYFRSIDRAVAEFQAEKPKPLTDAQKRQIERDFLRKLAKAFRRKA